jgi:hypothetical protein
VFPINRTPTGAPPQVTAQTTHETAPHETEAGRAPAQVRALSQAMIDTEVRLIADYLKEHVFAVHKQEMMPAPAGASQGELDEINAHNEHVTRNNQQLDRIADSRARVLQREGETLGDIADTLAKGEKFDRLAARTSSAFRATPFAAATVLQYMKPEINKGDWLPTPLKPLTPLISGALSGVMDQVGTGLMNRVTGDNQYLKTTPDKLHSAMADSLKRHAPGLLQQSADMGGAIQSYTARNVLRTVVATPLAGHPKAQAAVDTAISAAGGLAANAVFASRMQSTERRDHQRGAAHVFGRKDAEARPLDEETEWLQAYRDIKNASYTGAALNAGKRLAGMPIDILTDGSKAVRSLVSASSLTQNGLALATRNISNPYAKTAVSQLTNTLGSAGVFAGWTTAGVLTDPATRAAEDFLQNDVKRAASSATATAAHKTADGARYAADKTVAGVEFAAIRTAAGVEIAIDKTAAGIDKVATKAAAGVDAVVTTGAALKARYDNHVRRREADPESGIEMT